MKILYAVENYYPSIGGAQEVVRQLARGMARLGHTVTVATSKMRERKSLAHEGVAIVEFEIFGNSVRGYVGNKLSYTNFLLSNSFDVIIIYAAQQWSADIFFEVMDKITARKVFVPCGFSGLNDDIYKQYFQVMPEILHKFDATIFLSNDYRDINFVRKCNVKNIHVIPNGVDGEEFGTTIQPGIRSKLGIPQKNTLILTVGSHTGAKGHHEAIRIFKAARIKNATLLIVGRQSKIGCYRQCKRLANYGSVDPRLVLRGKQIKVVSLNREDTVAALFDSNVFLFTSNIECSPLVLFEAVAARSYILSTDVGNAREICSWLQTGAILPTVISPKGVSIAHIEKSAAKLCKLIDTLSSKGAELDSSRNIVLSQYNWNVIVRKYLEVINNIYVV